MREAFQLTLDGGEVALSGLRRTAPRPLSERQSDILAYARLRGGLLRPVQVGVIVHSHRPSHISGVVAGLADIDTRGIEPVRCCQWASKDGHEALKRLIARGLVERVSRGLYCVVGW